MLHNVYNTIWQWLGLKKTEFCLFKMNIKTNLLEVYVNFIDALISEHVNYVNLMKHAIDTTKKKYILQIEYSFFC